MGVYISRLLDESQQDMFCGLKLSENLGQQNRDAEKLRNAFKNVQ